MKKIIYIIIGAFLVGMYGMGSTVSAQLREGATAVSSYKTSGVLRIIKHDSETDKDTVEESDINVSSLSSDISIEISAEKNYKTLGYKMFRDACEDLGLVRFSALDMTIKFSSGYNRIDGLKFYYSKTRNLYGSVSFEEGFSPEYDRIYKMVIKDYQPGKSPLTLHFKFKDGTIYIP